MEFFPLSTVYLVPGLSSDFVPQSPICQSRKTYSYGTQLRSRGKPELVSECDPFRGRPRDLVQPFAVLDKARRAGEEVRS